MIDISNNDAFSIFRLSTAVDKIKHAPDLIEKLGIFEDRPIDTTSVAIEYQNEVLSLVSPSPRGSRGQAFDQGKRALIKLEVPHFEIADSLLADEVQNVRAFGSEDQLEAVMAKVNYKLAASARKLNATLEHLKVGALKGIVGYADGASLNLYNVIGVSQPATIDLQLDASTLVEGKLRADLVGIKRSMRNSLGGTSATGYAALVGAGFMDALQKNPDVRETYKAWEQAADLRKSYGGEGEGFTFADITFYEYRGEVGGVSFIEDDAAHFFPMGVPDLFVNHVAPGDLPGTVNTMGQRMYVNQYEMANKKGWHLDTQMNVLPICTRPESLRKATV